MVALLLLLLASPGFSPQSDGCTGPKDPAGALAAEIAALSQSPLPHSPLPSDFDLTRAAAGARALLAQQGEVVGPGVTELAFTDADHTAVKTVTPLYFRNAAGELLTDPETGALLMVRRRGAPEGARLLQQKYPQIDWSQWTMSWEEWDSIEGILSQEAIPVTVGKLRAAANRPHARVMVITARPAVKNGVAGFREWFRRRKVHLDGVFGVATPAQAAALQVDKPGYDDAMRKTLIIAANIEAYGPSVKKVTFYEDNDSNLSTAMQILPRLHPEIEFVFQRVVHHGDGKFGLKLAGRSPAGSSTVFGPEGDRLSPAEVKGFKMVDQPFDPGGF